MNEPEKIVLPPSRTRRWLKRFLYLAIATELVFAATASLSPVDINRIHYQHCQDLSSRPGSLQIHFASGYRYQGSSLSSGTSQDRLSFYSVSHPYVPAPLIACAKYECVYCGEVIEAAKITYLWTPWRLYELQRTPISEGY